MPLPEFLLAMLRCPSTKQPLALADAALVEQLQTRSSAGELLNLLGQSVPEFTELLVTPDGSRAYVVSDGIAHLVADEAIDLAAVGVAEPLSEASPSR